MTTSKGEIHDLFSSIAPRYDLLNTVLSLGTDRSWRRSGVEYLKGCHSVLDLCAGTLALTKALLKINPNTQITAVDFSGPMLDHGARTLTSEQLKRVSLECVDFMKWDSVSPEASERRIDSARASPGGGDGGDVRVAAPRYYDGAMCAYGMRNLEDNPRALKKLYGLLQKGGRLVVLEFFRPDRWYSWLFHRTYGEFVIPAIGSLVSRHKNAYRHLRDSVRGFYTLDQYAQLLREIGFEVKVAKRQTGRISGLIVAEKRIAPPAPLLR